MAALIHLRHDLSHAVLGLLFGVDRSTILLADRGVRFPTVPVCGCGR
ncbi:transposase family protein [Streptomyces collinus]